VPLAPLVVAVLLRGTQQRLAEDKAFAIRDLGYATPGASELHRYLAKDEAHCSTATKA
jgi:hypothetical protein